MSKEAAQTQPQEQSQSNSVDPLETVTAQAQQVIEGLDAAGLHYAAAAIQRQANKLETESDNLAKTIGQLANPKLLLALSYLKAGQIVDEDLSNGIQVGVKTLPKPKLNLPSVPSFGQYYSFSEFQDGQQQLTSGSNSTANKSENQNDQSKATEVAAHSSAPSSNGNSKKEQKKEFGIKAGN